MFCVTTVLIFKVLNSIKTETRPKTVSSHLFSDYIYSALKPQVIEICSFFAYYVASQMCGFTVFEMCNSVFATVQLCNSAIVQGQLSILCMSTARRDSRTDDIYKNAIISLITDTFLYALSSGQHKRSVTLALSLWL